MASSPGLNLDSTELCLMDCGIADFQDVPLRSHLQLLNLHGNFIKHIHSVSHLKFLKHLDLSSNQIQIIEGLDGLISLKTINLSCNLMKDVLGLGSLRSLTKLNVSYNQINNISGLKSLAGPAYKLSHVILHGNQLQSVGHITQSLCRCNNLQSIILSQDNSDNPVCKKKGYLQEIMSGLPQLRSLDGMDRSGQAVSSSDTDIPGVDDFLRDLLSAGMDSDGQNANQTSGSDIHIDTPSIDKALEKYRGRQQQQQVGSQSDTSSVIQSVTDTERSPGTSRSQSRRHDKDLEERGGHPEDHSVRLQMLEQQIADLLHKTKTQPPVFSSSTGPDESSSGGGARYRGGARAQHVTRHVAERDVVKTDGSDSEGGRKRTPGKKKGKKSRLPSYRRSTTSSRERAKKDKSVSGLDAAADKDADLPTMHHDVRDKGQGSSDSDSHAKTIRNDIQSTYVQIMQELEQERERRWKAEEAAKKLVLHVQKISGKAKEDSDMKEVAIDATTRLKQAVTNEREVKLRLLEERDLLKEQLKQMMIGLSKAKESEVNQTKSLREMEEMLSKAEREKLKQQTHEQKKLQEAMMKAAALGREADMLRNTVEHQKGQIHQLQSLLATREQEHRDEQKTRYGLGSKEMQEAIQEEVQRKQQQHIQQMKTQQEKIDSLSKQYNDLEDEFRQGLQIESSRFQQLKSAFETVSEENEQNKSALLAAQGKDEKMSDMVSELTALVKEQKGRIAELTKSKHEQAAQNKERIQVLEAHVEEARKRMIQLELLKQDSVKLKSQVHGQESVIEGLRAERKLWGQELAQQGASLAQDRGSLEAKISIQQGELNMLKKQCERETDALKIKTKMLEDQTETIRKLKEAVVERDEDIKKARHEALKIQQSLEEQMSEERTNSQDMQETLERLRERKEDLKQQVSEVQQELDESKKAHSILNNRWKEKSQLIGQLESQVREMKESWDNKEKKLTKERDKALHAANLAIERLKSADDTFRKELEDKVKVFQDQLALLEVEKQDELDQAYARVSQVEEEMRELLLENQSNKKGMEDKVKRLTRAMSDLQSDLY